MILKITITFFCLKITCILLINETNKHTHAYEPKSSIPHAYEPKSSILMLMNQNKAYAMHMKKIKHTSCL